jgi:hypothetical protein
MTTREAILRLCADANDPLAITCLRNNNAAFLHAVVARYFAAGPLAEDAEGLLMQRLAVQARSFERQENADKWLARCANQECDRLRNEAIRGKADSD